MNARSTMALNAALHCEIRRAPMISNPSARGVVFGMQSIAASGGMDPAGERAGRPRSQDVSLLRRRQMRGRRLVTLRFDFGGLLLDQLDDVVDEIRIVHFVMGLAGDVDHAAPCPAAGEAEIGLRCLAGAVDDAADD